MEHRWGKRQATDMRIRFVSAPAKIGTGRMTNISLSGAFLETPMNLRLLSVVYLSSITARGAKKGTGMAACVVRRDSRGVGLEWCDSRAEKVSVDARLALLADSGIETRPSARNLPTDTSSTESIPQFASYK